MPRNKQYRYIRNGNVPFNRVPTVLNSHGIKPTFLKFDWWWPGADFIPIIYSNVLNYIKKERMYKKKALYIQKTFYAIFKDGFNPVLGSIPRPPFDREPLSNEGT